MFRTPPASRDISFGDINILGSGKTSDEACQPAPGPLPLSVSANPKSLPAIETSVGKVEDEDIGKWSAQQVAAWMFNVGFENGIIEKFALHDITGAVLLDLQFEDLRDLDIPSYGKRRQLWAEILELRTEGGYSPNEKLMADIEKYYTMESGELLRNSSERKRRSEYLQRPLSMSHGPHKTDCSMVPEHTPQSTTMDEIIPKPHRCSKGEKCSKWKQAQSIIEEVDKQHGQNTPPSENRHRFAEFRPISLRPYSSESSGIKPNSPDPANHEVEQFTAELHNNRSSNTELQISKEQQAYQREDIGTSDQATRGTLPSMAPDGGPSSPSSSTGLRQKYHPPRASSLNGLPKLSIPPPATPVRQASPLGLRSPRTPSPYQKPRSPLSPPAPNALSPKIMPSSPTTGFRRRSPSADSPRNIAFPATHQLRSPASESEISPLTTATTYNTGNFPDSVSPQFANTPPLRPATSLDSVPKRRDFAPLPTVRESQSHVSPRTPRTNNVKPLLSKPLPVTPPLSTRGSCSSSETEVNSGRDPSSTRTTPEPAKPQDDSRALLASPCPSDITLVNNASPSRTYSTSSRRSTKILSTPVTAPDLPFSSPAADYGPKTIRTGWVRRRRARLWRHEWQSAHLRLTKTHLTLHASSRVDDTDPIETIDVDDYAVACSSVNNGGKLAAAMRSVGNMGTLGGKIMVDGGECFAWQLVPMTAAGVPPPRGGRSSSNGSIPASANPVLTPIDESKEEATLSSTKKAQVLRTQHFAVKTRDDRIDWMREVMLAKAMRQKQKDQGQKQRFNQQIPEQAPQVEEEKVKAIAKVVEINGSLSEEGTRARTSLETHPADVPVVRCGSF